MDECFWIGLVLALLGLGPLLAIVALVKLAGLQRRFEDLERSLRRLQHAARAEPEPSPRSATGGEVPPPMRGPSPSSTSASASPHTPVAATPASVSMPAATPATPPPLPARATAAPPPLPAEVTPVPRPARAATESLEQAIGTRWLVRVGAFAVFVGIAFLLKYSFDQGWLGPLPRVLGGAAVGLAMWGLAWHWRTRYPALAHGVFAAGSGLLYLVSWAAYGLYDLLAYETAFGAMLAVTAATLTFAHRLVALPPAVLGLCGGYLTPILLGGEGRPPGALLGYAGLLSVAALWLRWRHAWSPLGAIATAGSGLLVTVYAVHGPADQHATALAVQTGLLLLALLGAGPLQGTLRRATLSPVDLAGGAAAAMGTWVLWWTLRADTGNGLPLGCALVAALAFAAVGVLHWRRVPDDAQGREGLWLPAAGLLALALCFPLAERGLTLGLAVLGVLLGLLGRRLPATAVTAVGTAAALWATARTVIALLPELERASRPAADVLPVLPFTSGADWVDLTVVLALLAMAQIGPRAAIALAAVGAALLVPLTARELLAWFLPADWPHPDPDFGNALAWGLPLGAVAVLAIRAREEALRVIAGIAAAGAVLTLVPMLLIGTDPRSESWPRFWQYLGLALVALAPVRTAALATRQGLRPGSALAVAGVLALGAAHLVPLCEIGRALDEAHGRFELLIVAFLLAWPPRFRSADRWPRAGWAAALPPLLLPLLAAFLLAIIVRLGWPVPVVAPAAAAALAAAALWLGMRRLRPDLPGPQRVGLDLCGTIGLGAATAGIPLLQQPHTTLYLNGPFLLLFLGPLLLLLSLLGERRQGLQGPERLGNAMRWIACWLGLLALCSGEGWRWAVQAAERHGWGDRAGHVTLSLVWTVWATGSLIAGVLARLSPVRWLALLLFGATLVKVMLFDLAELPTPMRVLSFLGIGLALMGAGWLYHRFAGRIAEGDRTP